MILRLTTFAILGLLLLSNAGARADDAPRAPNIVFILADDLGWGDLGCYGNNQIKTPHLDRFAAEGTLFTQFYVNGSVCSPSRTAFMTGQFPARHAMHGHLAGHDQNAARGMPNWLDPKSTTLPRLLKTAGYATAHIGKWHLGGGPGAPHPGEYGFDFVRATTSGHDTWPEGNQDPHFRAKSTGLFVDAAIEFIGQAKAPFYLQLWTLLPHAPLNPLPEQLKPFEQFGPTGKAAGGHKGARAIYYASVADLDAQVGRLVEAIDKAGLKDNTLILVSSDNGPEEIFVNNAGHSGVGSPGPFRGRKRSLYEGGVRVPFIARWPTVVPAGRVDETSVVSAVDFLPTLCELAGEDVPADSKLDGVDRGGCLRGQSTPRERPLFWEWRFNIAGHAFNHSPLLAIRDGDWKLLLNPDRSRVELYDIPRDPMELANRAGEYPEIVERLAAQALDWQKTLPAGPLDPGAGQQRYGWPKTPKSR